MSYSDWLMGAVQRSTGNATGGNPNAPSTLQVDMSREAYARAIDRAHREGVEAGRAAFAADLAEQGKVVVDRDILQRLLKGHTHGWILAGFDATTATETTRTADQLLSPAEATNPAWTISREMTETNPASIMSQLTPDDGGVYGQNARAQAAIHNALHPDNPVKTLREWEEDSDV